MTASKGGFARLPMIVAHMRRDRRLFTLHLRYPAQKSPGMQDQPPQRSPEVRSRRADAGGTRRSGASRVQLAVEALRPQSASHQAGLREDRLVCSAGSTVRPAAGVSTSTASLDALGSPLKSGSRASIVVGSFHGTPSSRKFFAGSRHSGALAAHIQVVKPSTATARSLSALVTPAEKHGSWSGYAYYKCRCVACVEAGRLYGIQRRQGKKTPEDLLTPRPVPEHGTRARYARGCGCEPCRVAGSRARVPLGVPSTFRRYKYQVQPSPQAAAAMARVFGAVRWVHNAYVAAARDAYADGLPHLNGYAGSKLIVTAGRANPETAWLQELPSNVLRASVMNAAKGYQAFFDSCSGKRKGPRMGRPRFRKRGGRESAEFGKSSFAIKGGWETTQTAAGGRLRLSKVGMVSVNWHRPLPSEPSTATIVREPDGTWWVTFVVEVAKRPTTPVKSRTAAIDLGLSTYAAIVYSDGTREKVDNPRFLRQAERKLAKAQRTLSRKARGARTARRLECRSPELTRGSRTSDETTHGSWPRD